MPMMGPSGGAAPAELTDVNVLLEVISKKKPLQDLTAKIKAFWEREASGFAETSARVREEAESVKAEAGNLRVLARNELDSAKEEAVKIREGANKRLASTREAQRRSVSEEGARQDRLKAQEEDLVAREEALVVAQGSLKEDQERLAVSEADVAGEKARLGAWAARMTAAAGTPV